MRKKIFLLGLILLLVSILRIYKISQIPSGFYSDESLYGYEAYSILQTGRDQYGNFMPLVFKAFGDYRPGLFIYTIVPFVKIFGLNEFATRLPSALFSIATCLSIFLLSYELLRKYSSAFCAAFLFAISPFSLQFSRMSHEANLATFLVVLATYFFLRGIKSGWNLIISFVLFSLSFYAYYNTRIFVPLWLLTLFIFNWKRLLTKKKYLVLGIVAAVLLTSPMLKTFISRDVGWSRVDAVSLWGDPGIASKTNQFRGEDVMAKSPAQFIFHNKIIDGGIAFLASFSTHFSPQFLFFQGDPTPLYQTPNTGLLYTIELFLLIVGFYLFWKRKNQAFFFFLLWIVYALLPDTLTRLSPAAPRIHLALPALSLVGGFGLSYILSEYKINFSRLTKLAFWILSFFTLFQVGYFLHQNFVHAPVRYALEWHYGLKELISDIKLSQDKYQQVWVSKKGWGWINFLFYLKYPPEKIQKEIVLSQKNEYGLGWVYGFGKYKFDDFPPKIETYRNTLFVSAPSDFSELKKPLYTVYYPNGDPAFYIADWQSF